MDFEKGFYTVPNDINDIDLDVYEFRVILYLMRCANNSTAYPSITTIQNKCKMSRPKVTSTIKALEGKGLITKTKRSGTSTIYGVTKNPTRDLTNNRPTNDELVNDVNHQLVNDMNFTSKQHELNKELNTNNSLDKQLFKTYLISDKNEDVILSLYQKYYSLRFNKNHPTIKPHEMYNKIYLPLDKLKNTFDLTDSQWEEVIEHHFEKLAETNDGKIYSFLADNGGHSCVWRYVQELF